MQVQTAPHSSISVPQESLETSPLLQERCGPTPSSASHIPTIGERLDPSLPQTSTQQGQPRNYIPVHAPLSPPPSPPLYPVGNIHHQPLDLSREAEHRTDPPTPPSHSSRSSTSSAPSTIRNPSTRNVSSQSNRGVPPAPSRRQDSSMEEALSIQETVKVYGRLLHEHISRCFIY